MVDMVHREKYDMDLYRTQEDIIDFLHNLRKITEPHYLKTEGRKKIKNENIAYSAKRLSDYLNLLDSAYNETAFAENPVPQELSPGYSKPPAGQCREQMPSHGIFDRTRKGWERKDFFKRR